MAAREILLRTPERSDRSPEKPSTPPILSAAPGKLIAPTDLVAGDPLTAVLLSPPNRQIPKGCNNPHRRMLGRLAVRHGYKRPAFVANTPNYQRLASDFRCDLMPCPASGSCLNRGMTCKWAWKTSCPATRPQFQPTLRRPLTRSRVLAELFAAARCSECAEHGPAFLFH